MESGREREIGKGTTLGRGLRGADCAKLSVVQEKRESEGREEKDGSETEKSRQDRKNPSSRS
jgi:hypothetical protein